MFYKQNIELGKNDRGACGFLNRKLICERPQQINEPISSVLDLMNNLLCKKMKIVPPIIFPLLHKGPVVAYGNNSTTAKNSGDIITGNRI